MNNVGGQMQHLAQQRDHRQLVDLMASFLDEFRKYGRFMTPEALQLGEPLRVSLAWSYGAGA
jgi:hypothetical protein